MEEVVMLMICDNLLYWLEFNKFYIVILNINV